MTTLKASQKTKQTPVGEIPVDWECGKLRDLIGELKSGTSVSGRDGIPRNGELGLLKVSSVTSGRFRPFEMKAVEDNYSSRLKTAVRADSVLVNRANGSADLVGSAVYVGYAAEDLFLPDKLWQIRADANRSSSRFLAHLLSWTRFRNSVFATSSGGTGMRNISSRAYQNIRVPIPPLPEQKKIAEILGTWDRAIRTLEDLIAAKQEHKRGQMQRLLFGKTRLPGFTIGQQKLRRTKFGDVPADWKDIKIRDLASQAIKKNAAAADFPVMSCTKHRGLVDSLEYFGKQVFSKDTSTYKVVRRGQFAYATNHIDEGSIGYQNRHDRALISPMYTVFETNDLIDDSFLFRLLKSEVYLHIFRVMTSASVSRRGSLRWSQFSIIPIALPSLREQKRIAQVLDTCDREIELQKARLEKLREQKRGLMQRLLTGQVRVKPEGASSR